MTLLSDLYAGGGYPGTGEQAFLDADHTKLDGIENNATADNISDANVTDLTDGLDTTLHDHDGISENTAARHTQNTDTALGAQSENLNMNTHKIVGVVDPTTNQEAATKKYVDDNAGGASYEAGYYEPTLTCSTSGSYTTFGNVTLAKTKIGRTVHIQGKIDITEETSPNGALRLSIPYTSATLTQEADLSLSPFVTKLTGGTFVNPHIKITAGTAYGTLIDITDAGVQSDITHADVDSVFSLYFNFTYLAA